MAIEIIQSVQAATEILSKLRELSKKVENADFRILLADLANELADAKLHAADLKTQLVDTRTELEELRAITKNKEASKPKVVDGGYSFDGEEALFCTTCYDKENKKIILHENTAHFTVYGKYKCNSCGSNAGLI